MEDLTNATAVAGGDASQICGTNLLPCLAGKKSGATHAALFWRSRMMSDSCAARADEWKFAHGTEGDATPGPKQTPASDQLYNLATDLGEQRNLATEHLAQLAESER